MILVLLFAFSFVTSLLVSLLSLLFVFFALTSIGSVAVTVFPFSVYEIVIVELLVESSVIGKQF